MYCTHTKLVTKLLRNKNLVRLFMNHFLVLTRQHRSAFNSAKRNFKIKFYYLLIAGSGGSEIIDIEPS